MHRPKNKEVSFANEIHAPSPQPPKPSEGEKPAESQKPKRGVLTEPIDRPLIPDARDQFDGYAGTTIDM